MIKFSFAGMFSLLLFAYTGVKAQYIPDSNFAVAISNACPTCIDTSHYLTVDAQTLISLDIPSNSGVNDLTGLDGFTNLQKFTCSHQFVSVLPALPPNIDTVIIEWNQLITSLPLLPSSLQYLDCYENDIAGLPSLPASLTYLRCGRNQLSSLPLLPSSLVYLDCRENGMTASPVLPDSLTYVDISGNTSIGSLPLLPSSLLVLNCRALSDYFALPDLPPNLIELNCGSNDGITSLPALPSSLTYLNCEGDYELTALPSLPESLRYLIADFCALTSLPPLGNNLYWLDCWSNPLVHLPSLPSSLHYLTASYCGLLDMPPLPDSLDILWIDHNLIASLPNLPSAEIYPDINITHNPISCLPYIPSNVPYLDITGTNITCLPNIPPGFDNYANIPLCEAGNLNGCFAYPTISGNVYGDFNSNMAFDSGEYHASNVIVEVNPGNYIGISDSGGNYKIWVPLSSTDTTNANPSSYYIAPSTYYTVTFDTISGQESLNNDFGIGVVSNGSNLDVALELQSFRPGFNTNVWVTIRNVGTENLDGTADLTFDPLLTFVSADQGGTASGNVVTWDFNGLHPFQTNTFTATINCPTSAVLGTIVNNNILGVVNGATDIDLVNNSLSVEDTIIGSFDPNDKEVNDASLTPDELANGKYLEYTIHFQNTGTAPATFINVIDTLSDKLDASTFEMIAASHLYDIALANDLTKANHPVFVKWIFNNIQLPDSSENFANSQGFVKFRIKPKNSLLIGDQIQNIAGIYFDFNEPVITNITVTDVALADGIANVSDDFFRTTIYPNPAANTTTIHFDHVTSEQLSLQIADGLGTVLMEKIISVPHESFDINLDLKKFHSGVYVITVKSPGGVQVMKLVKD